MLTRGDVLNNRYRVVKSVSQGGMAMVYRGWDINLNIPLAIKEMTPQPGITAPTLQGLTQQFRQEAQVLAKLDHPNLVKVLDFFEENGKAYLIMKYVDGQSLAQHIEMNGALSESEAVAVAIQVLDALAYCHDKGVIHRDIKPENIIIEKDNNKVQVVDFGLVKLWDPNDPHTKTVMHGMGTPEYAPPEQYGLHGRHTDSRSDLYSLGATMYHALTGQLPITVTDRMAFPKKFVPVSGHSNQVSGCVETAVMRAMELSPDDRFQTAAEMKAALQQPSSGTYVMSPSQGSDKTVIIPPSGGGQDKTIYAPSGGSYSPPHPPYSPPLPMTPSKRATPKWVFAIPVILLLLAAGLWFAFFQDAGTDESITIQEETEQTTKDLIAEADRLATDGQYDDAIAIYKDVLASESDNVTAQDGLKNSLYQQANHDFEAQDYAKAEEGSLAILKDHPDDANANLLLAQIYQQQDKLESAIPYYETAYSLDANLKAAQSGLGWAYYELGSYDEALTVFTSMVNQYPSDVDGLSGLGKSYYSLEWYDEAIAPLQQWNQQLPALPESHKLLGLSYEQLGDVASAESHYRRWAQLEQDELESINAKLYWAESLFKLKKYSEATTIFEEITALSPSSLRAWSGLAHSYQVTKQYEKALQALEKASELAPDNHAIIARIAEVYFLLEDYRSAVSYYETAISMDGNVADYHAGLGNSWRALQEHKQAIAAYQQAANLEPNNAVIISRMASSYFALQDYDNAISFYEKAILLDNSVASFHSGLGNAYRELRSYEQAIIAYQKAIALEADNPITLSRIASCYLAIQDNDNAATYYERAIALDDKVASFHNGLGQALRQSGNCEQAIPAFRQALALDPQLLAAQQGLDGCK